MRGEGRVVEMPARRLPVVADVDVAVCGGGPAGFVAAVAAARAGARTILIERYGFLGGMATAGLVGPIGRFWLNDERLVDGIPWEFVEEMARRGGAITDVPRGNVPFEAEVYKGAAADMVAGAGSEMLLHSRVVDCLWDEGRPGRVTHLVVENAAGRQAVETRTVIDCTGMGHLIAQTRLPWRYRAGDPAGSQPMSLVFRLAGVDMEQVPHTMRHDGVEYVNQSLRAALQEAVEAGEMENFGGPWTLRGSTMLPGMVMVNVTRYAGDVTDAGVVTRAELEMRRAIPHIVEIFRRGDRAFRGCYLVDTATQAGIREARAIEGLYTVTEEDVVAGRQFADSVARGGHPVDMHRPGDAEQRLTFLRRGYGIPYRALVPRGSENLLVAGGILSATREAFGSIRVQAQCMATGQAAGVAAAMCCAEGVGVGELDGVVVRERLRCEGAVVDGATHR